MMNDDKGGVTKVTCSTSKAMGQIPAFHICMLDGFVLLRSNSISVVVTRQRILWRTHPMPVMLSLHAAV